MAAARKRATVPVAPRLGVKESEYNKFTFEPELPAQVLAVVRGGFVDEGSPILSAAAKSAVGSGVTSPGGLVALQSALSGKVEEAVNCTLTCSADDTLGSVKVAVTLRVPAGVSAGTAQRQRTAAIWALRQAMDEMCPQHCVASAITEVTLCPQEWE